MEVQRIFVPTFEQQFDAALAAIEKVPWSEAPEPCRRRCCPDADPVFRRYGGILELKCPGCGNKLGILSAGEDAKCHAELGEYWAKELDKRASVAAWEAKLAAIEGERWCPDEFTDNEKIEIAEAVSKRLLGYPVWRRKKKYWESLLRPECLDLALLAHLAREYYERGCKGHEHVGGWVGYHPMCAAEFATALVPLGEMLRDAGADLSNCHDKTLADVLVESPITPWTDMEDAIKTARELIQPKEMITPAARQIELVSRVLNASPLRELVDNFSLYGDRWYNNSTRRYVR